MITVWIVLFLTALAVKLISFTALGLVFKGRDSRTDVRQTYIRSVQASAACARAECPGIDLSEADLEGVIARMTSLRSEDTLKCESRTAIGVINSLVRRYRQAKREEEAAAEEN